MKKMRFRRGLFLGLTLAMALGLGACGGKGKSMENAGLAKEHVYKVSAVELPIEKPDADNSTSVLQVARVEDRIYVLLRTDIWGYKDDGWSDSDFYGQRTTYSMVNMDLEGGDQKITEIKVPDPSQEAEPETPDLPEEEETEDGTGSDDTDGDLDGEDIADAAVEDYVENNVWESNYYGSFVINTKGELYGIRTYTREESTEEGWSSQSRYYVCRWAEDGTFLWEKEIESLATTAYEWMYLDTVSPMPDGTILLLIRGDSNSRVVVDAEGNASPREELSEELDTIFNNLERAVVRPDGTLFLIYRDADEWQKTFCVDYDIAADKLGEARDLPSSVLQSWDYNIMMARENGSLLFTTSSGIYTYTVGDEEPAPMMDYINSDVFVSSFNGLVELSDQSFLGVYTESWGEGMKAGLFTYVDPGDIQDKAVIVLAGDWVDYDLRKRAIDFNTTSEDYRIVIREYDIYDTYDDYNGGITKLNNDIISGNMPDILVDNGYNRLPIETYIAKGWIADVGKLIEEDEELSQKEFAQNVFDAYSVNGKLYYLVPDFEVYTVMAKKSLIGDRTSWTMADMQQVLDNAGGEMTAFGNEMTRDQIMNMVMRYCGSQFMDVSSGKCNFNTEDFISMMEFAKSFPEEFNYDEDYWMNYDYSKVQAQYRENRTLMMQANLYYFQDIPRTINGYFGENEPVSFVGFPTESGKGSYVMSNRVYVFSAKSPNLEGAWQFMRYYLSDEYQKDGVSYFPVSLEQFYERSKEATERPYWEDENGEKEYYDRTMYINGESIIVPPLTQEQLDQVTEFLLSVDNRYYSNEFIENIVNEEIGAFYSGQKSAQDVADVIQRRAQVYVDENQ
ncbi:MAG: extracellular solute-binding protein [bacterium]|nr:extracellular solute-binding protein [bacterium]